MVANSLGEVIPLIELAEHEALRGNYVALMLTYEAAPAFDSSLQTHGATQLPLAWAAVFADKSPIPSRSGTTSTAEWKPEITRAKYDDAIKQIRARITCGDTYQVNYSFPLVSHFIGDAFAWYRSLSQAQGGQHSAILDLGRYQILSISPELFFQRRGDLVRTKPMKGTIGRGRWLDEDKEFAQRLAHSEKDKAENVMIVDLLRNDLGKVSVNGSVEVSKLFELERFETVWQMTSTVESKLRPNTSLSELLGALFPCGSITGAPKIRTMEIIRELEPHSRGAYTGTIGLLQPGGDCVFNVAIRTIVLDSETGRATFGVGGGITIDSTADSEYEECLTKARFLTSEPRQFDLFESMLLEDGEYFLIERHLARLRSSASFFGFEFSDSEVNSALESLKAEHPEGKWKTKLMLEKNGTVSTQMSKVEPTKDWIVGIASSAVDSNNRLLFHKTTARDLFSTELKSRPDCDDVVFFNKRGEVTESTLGNVVLEIDGRLVTPPRSAGLLAGTFRDQLIAESKIEERTLTLDELRNAKQFFLINSVRKWVRATLV